MADNDRFSSPIGIGLIRDKDGNFKGNPSAYEIEVGSIARTQGSGKNARGVC